MFNPNTKFEVSTVTCNEEMKGNAKCNMQLSCRWQMCATRCMTTYSKNLKQSRDHNHTLFVGDV